MYVYIHTYMNKYTLLFMVSESLRHYLRMPRSCVTAVNVGPLVLWATVAHISLSNSIRAHKGPEMWTQPWKESVSFFSDIVLCGWMRLLGYDRKTWIYTALFECNLALNAMALILLRITFCPAQWDRSVLLNDAVSSRDYMWSVLEELIPNMEHWWYMGKPKRITRRKSCQIAALCTTSPTWPCLECNTNLRGKKPATYCNSLLYLLLSFSALFLKYFAKSDY